MMDNIDEVTDKSIEALEEIEKDKRRVARAYNKKVKAKSFQVGDLVWKTILPIGSKSNKFGLRREYKSGTSRSSLHNTGHV
jgi:hypothetical protein